MADGSVIFDTKLDTSGIIKDLSGLAAGTLKTAMAGLAALGTYAIHVGSDFETAMSQVHATMGSAADATVEYSGKTMTALEAISKEASRLGAETAFSASQAAEGFNILAQSGLEAGDQIATMGHVLDLAAAGALSLEEAASFTAGTVKGFGDSFDNSQYYVDMMAQGATLASTDVRGLGEAMADSAATASTYGQNAEETALALLRLAEQGETGSAAATALSAAMKNLYAPTDQARAAMQELGVSAFDPISGKARNFNEVVDDLNNALAGYSDEQRIAYAQTIFGIQGFNAFNKMSVTSTEKVEQFRQGLRTASNEMDGAGAAAQQAAIQLDNLQGDVTILNSATEGFGKAIYEHMQGPLREFVQEATGIMSDLKLAVDQGGLSGLASAVGEALTRAITMIAEYAPELVSAAAEIVHSLAGSLIEAAPHLADVATEVGTNFLSGIQVITADLLQLGAELILAVCEGITSNLDSLLKTLTDGAELIAKNYVAYVPRVIQAGIELVGALASGIIKAAPSLVETAISLITDLAESAISTADTFIQVASDVIVALVNALPLIIGNLVTALPALIEGIIEGLKKLIPNLVQCGIDLFTALISSMPEITIFIVSALPELITAIVGGLLEMLPMLVDCGVKLFTSLVQALPKIIYNIVRVLPDIIAAIIDTLAGMIPKIIECGIDLLTSLVSAMPQIIGAIVAAIPSIIMSIISALVEGIPKIIKCGVDFFTSLIKALPEIIMQIVTAIPEIIGSIIDAFTSNIDQIAESGKQLFSSLVNSLPDIIINIVAVIPEIISAIIETIVSFGGDIVDAGYNLFMGLADGIGNAIGGVIDKAVDACSGIVDSVLNFFGIASPSKLFKNLIGKNLMRGLAEGIIGETNVAVDAAEKAAEEVARVDFHAKPRIDFDSFDAAERIALQNSVNYEALLSGARDTVRSARAVSGIDIAGNAMYDFNAKIESLQKYLESVFGTDKIKIPDAIDATLNIDGHMLSRQIAPYMAKDLDWDGI